MNDIVKRAIKWWDSMPQGSSREQKMEMVLMNLRADMRRYDRQTVYFTDLTYGQAVDKYFKNGGLDD